MKVTREKEEGQALLESAAAFLFLLLILIIMFEAAVVFASYIALLNTSIQGAIYAASHPNMENDPPDAHYEQYESIIREEALAGKLTWDNVTVAPPELPANVTPGQPITVTVSYEVTTFTSELIFPMFGRLGLPSSWRLSARTAVPIR